MNFDTKRNIIYCDLDGVLADFDVFKRKNLTAEAQEDDDVMWAEISEMPDFYRHLPPTPYAAELWRAIKSIGAEARILTAIPRKTTMPSAEEDKRWWCQWMHHIFQHEKVKVLIGPYSKDKHKHANPGDILIDDRKDNCEQWAAAGGIAIFHEGDVKQTINCLKLVTELNV